MNEIMQSYWIGGPDQKLLYALRQANISAKEMVRGFRKLANEAAHARTNLKRMLKRLVKGLDISDLLGPDKEE